MTTNRELLLFSAPNCGLTFYPLFADGRRDFSVSVMLQPIFTHGTDCSPRTYLYGELRVDENYLVITAVERMRMTKKTLCYGSFEATVYPLE